MTASGRRLVVLDIDDTLYLERDYVRSGFAAVGAWAQDELGVDGLGDRAWAAVEAGTRRTIFDEALAASGVEATDDLTVVYTLSKPNTAFAAALASGPLGMPFDPTAAAADTTAYS